MKLLTVGSFDNPVQAHLLKLRLEGQGIPCVVFDEHSISWNPMWNIVLGGIKVKVRDEDMERAQGLLRTLEIGPWLDEANNVIACPKCGSDKLYGGFRSFRGLKGLASGIISVLLFTWPLYLDSRYCCKKCGMQFKADR